MKSTDLRIGNKILLGNEVVDVLEIWSNGLRVTNSGTGCGYTYDQFSPIALTEEWLERFGFELKGVIFRINNGLSTQFDVNYSLSRNFFYYDSSKYGVYTEVRIKYLHQLQNLYFALTGKELTLKTTK